MSDNILDDIEEIAELKASQLIQLPSPYRLAFLEDIRRQSTIIHQATCEVLKRIREQLS